MSGRTVSVAGNAVGSAILGAYLGYAFIPEFVSIEALFWLAAKIGLTLAPDDVSWFAAALGATSFGIFGIVGGRKDRAEHQQRMAGFKETAASLGPEFSPAPDTGLSENLQPFFANVGLLQAHNVMRTELQGVRIETADVTYETRTGTQHNQRSHTVSQTVAYHKPAAARCPSFTLQPEGRLVNLLSRMLGAEDIDFPGHPDFSEAYHLTAVHAERTRALFNRPVLDALTRHRGLHIESDSGGIVIYRSATVCAPDELKAFVTEAAEIFRLLGAGVDAAYAIPEMDARAVAESMPGLLGRFILKRLVTQADIDAFLAQKPPRKIPANLLLYRDKVAPGIAVIVGVAFALGGAFQMFMLAEDILAARKTGLIGELAARLILPLIFTAVGGVAAFLFGRKRLRVTRLLSRGRVCEAKIEKIQDTGSSMGDETTDAMIVVFQPERRVVRASFKLTRLARSRARTLEAEGKPATILYDRTDPTRILFVDALLTSHPDWDAERTP